MQISTKTGVVHAMLSSFDVPENTRSKRAEQQYRGAPDCGQLPELLVSPRRAICSSARLPQLLRVRDTLYASEMSTQGVRWQLPPLAPHSTWQHLQIEDKERSPSREVSS